MLSLGTRIKFTSRMCEGMSLVHLECHWVIGERKKGELVAVTNFITLVLATWVKCLQPVCGDVEAARKYVF